MSEIRRKILVVDDQAYIRKIVVSIIRNSELNADVLAVEDSKKAMQVIERGKLDLIITDLHMPDMHGHELIQLIRQNGLNKFASICVLSGSDKEEDISESRQAGANAFVQKPVDKQNLLKTISRLI